MGCRQLNNRMIVSNELEKTWSPPILKHYTCIMPEEAEENHKNMSG